MSVWRRWTILLAWLAVLSAQVSGRVKITELRVPAAVEHNTNSTAVLDCEYDLDGHQVRMLTVQWYFNDDKQPVYQWVSGYPPSSRGILRDRVHLEHVASSAPLMKHRALSISNPTVELGGNYKCKVVTDVGVHEQTKKMIVYAPARTMNLTQDKPSPTSVNITCLVEGVYPAPELELFATQEDQEESRKLLEDVEESTEVTEEGLYDAVVHTAVDDTTLEGNTVFECVMNVPGTQYTLKRATTYSSGDAVIPSAPAPNETQITATLLFNETHTEVTDLGLELESNGVMEGAVLAASKSGAVSRTVAVPSSLLAVCLFLVSLHR